MAYNREPIINTLCNWTETIKAELNFDRFFAFGSLISKNGLEFVPGVSDIDMICCFSQNLQSPSSRAEEQFRLRNFKHSLEKELLSLLSWKDAGKPIISLVPITDFELSHGIHKGKNPLFFKESNFLDLLQPSLDPNPLSLSNHSAFHITHRDALSAIFAAQDFRNKYLAISANGDCKTEEWNENDVIPKPLAREAAQLRFYKEALKDDTKFSVNYGTFYFHKVLENLAQRQDEYRELLEWFMIRSTRRGSPLSLIPENHLKLWEILLNEAIFAIEKQIALDVDSQIISERLKKHSTDFIEAESTEIKKTSPFSDSSNIQIGNSPESRLERFKNFFQYATSVNGPNMLRGDAVKWAEDKVKSYTDDDIEEFKRLFEYATSVSGPNMLKGDAVKWAESQIEKK